MSKKPFGTSKKSWYVKKNESSPLRVPFRVFVLGPHDPMKGPHDPMQSLLIKPVIGRVHMYVGASSVQEKKREASSIKFPQLLTTNQPAIPT
jgi:hypothetical protein